MRFRIYSRLGIERSEPPDAPHAIISITTTESDLVELPQSVRTRGVLRLTFPDMVTPCTGWSEDRLFTRNDAERICEFVDEHAPRIEELLVHCDAGMSRSPAVAAALSKALYGDDRLFFERYIPNQRVYRILLEACLARRG